MMVVITSARLQIQSSGKSTASQVVKNNLLIERSCYKTELHDFNFLFSRLQLPLKFSAVDIEPRLEEANSVFPFNKQKQLHLKRGFSWVEQMADRL